MKEYNVTTEQHRNLLDRFFKGHYDSWSQYKDRAEILWEGEHYIVIRTGMSENRSRYVWLADKIGLLAPDEDDAPLAQLAGATVHPVQIERADEAREILHDSNQDDNEGKFKGRWCKTRKAQCIAYAYQRDQTYGYELPGWIADYEKRKAEEKALEREERRFATRLVRRTRERLKVRKRTSWDKGVIATREVTLSEKLGSFCFSANTVNEGDWRVNIHSRGDSLSLTESQFCRFVDLMVQFVEEERTG